MVTHFAVRSNVITTKFTFFEIQARNPFMTMWNPLLLLLPFVVFSRQVDRNLRILNDSRERVELFWIHPTTRATTRLSTPFIYDGASFPLKTYIGHEFEVREIVDEKTGECHSEDHTCKVGQFNVSAHDDQRKCSQNHLPSSWNNAGVLSIL